jgi:hypothetical protein
MSMLDNPRDVNEYLKDFIKKLIDTRNYLTHFSTEQRARAFHGDEIEDAALICWAALTFWLGRELGIDEDRARGMTLAAKEAMFLVHPQNRL